MRSNHTFVNVSPSLETAPRSSAPFGSKNAGVLEDDAFIHHDAPAATAVLPMPQFAHLASSSGHFALRSANAFALLLLEFLVEGEGVERKRIVYVSSSNIEDYFVNGDAIDRAGQNRCID